MFGGMPGGNEIQIIISAVDNASRQINGIDSRLSQFQAGLKATAIVSKAVVTSVEAVGRAIIKLADEYTAYADQVRNLTRLTGMSAEASSQMIQVADDLMISYGEMSIALKYMVRQGLDPSIDSLAKLSDEYLTLQPGLERSSFLMEKFGRSGVSMAAMMEEGSTALLEMNGLIDENLILTQENINTAKEYKESVDQLTDSWQALKTAGEKELVPILIDILDFLNQNTVRAGGTTKAFQELQWAFMDTGKAAGIFLGKLLDATERVYKIDLGREKINHFKDALKEPIADTFLDDFIDGLGIKLPAALETAEMQMDMFTGQMIDMNTALAQQQAEFGFIISFAAQYETNLDNVTQAEGELARAEADLATARSKWPEASQQVQDAKQKVDELTGKLGDAQKASDDATNEMIAGFLQTQLTMDGTFTENDIRKVLNYRYSVGLLTAEAYNAALGAMEIVQNMALITDKDVRINIFTNRYDQTISGADGVDLSGNIVTGSITTTIAPSAISGMSEVQRASAAKFWASQWHPEGALNPYGNASGGSGMGWGIVGDARDGHRTGYEEAIYAPGGYTVYPTSSSVTQSVLHGSAPSHAGGGAIPSAISNSSVELSSITIRELARAIGAEVGRMNE